MNKSNAIKKYLVLGVLFLLPITAYLFFASGVNNFGKLPVLTENVADIIDSKDIHGETVQLKDHISVLGFFGKDVESKKANAFNLAHKIYKKYYQFKDFQCVILIDKSQIQQALLLKEKLGEIENSSNWKFIIATPETTRKVFNSLKSDYTLDSNESSPYVFIIDYEQNLRGRDDENGTEMLYGFDARDYSIINNKMDDDIKVILAEYRLELKKYKSKK